MSASLWSWSVKKPLDQIAILRLFFLNPFQLGFRIVVIETEESYTRKTSFLDHEMPIRKRQQDEKEARQVSYETPYKKRPVPLGYGKAHQWGCKRRFADLKESSPKYLCKWDRGDRIFPGQAKSEFKCKSCEKDAYNSGLGQYSSSPLSDLEQEAWQKLHLTIQQRLRYRIRYRFLYHKEKALYIRA